MPASGPDVAEPGPVDETGTGGFRASEGTGRTSGMLDPATCAGMVLGVPRVTLAALAELHQHVTERGFRRSSRDDPIIVQEQQHEELARAGGVIRGPTPA